MALTPSRVGVAGEAVGERLAVEVFEHEEPDAARGIIAVQRRTTGASAPVSFRSVRIWSACRYSGWIVIQSPKRKAGNTHFFFADAGFAAGSLVSPPAVSLSTRCGFTVPFA